MPFKSQAQRRWMHATHPAMAQRWERETPRGRLPARAGAGLRALKRARPRSSDRRHGPDRDKED